MEENVIRKPALPVIVRGRLQKTCGPLQRYGSRTIELLEDGYLYVFLDGMSEPQSRILVLGCVLSNNSDSPLGFTLLCADKKQKFVCPDVESKATWFLKLSEIMNKQGGSKVEPSTTKRRHVSARFVAIDRSSAPLIEGNLLKRSGMASYSMRWCEVRENIGFCYAKSRGMADDEFKVVPLRDAHIASNASKLRITITPSNGDEPTFIRADQPQDFQRWKDVITQEAGSEWEKVDFKESLEKEATVTNLSLASELDSDDELELADLESESPIRAVKVEAELSSISRTVSANMDTPGFEETLQEKLKQMGNYGFMELLKQFEQKMSVPIYGPYAALHRHITSLDVDAQKIRFNLCALLDEFPREVKVALVAQQADRLLMHCHKVREIYVIRRDIAEFRELKGESGLALGVNGTLVFLSDIARKKPAETATSDDVQKVEKIVQNLSTALMNFRYDYDVFDDAYFTIEEIEKCIRDTRAWISETERVSRERSI